MKYSKIAAVSGVLGGVLVVLALSRPSAAQEASRYPYDPVCAWGRIANGKGMLVRCLSQQEASALLASAPAPKPTSAPTPAPSASAAPTPAPSASAPPSEPPADDAQKVVFKSVSVAADAGKLPAAEKKLSLAKDKLVECLGKGGLEKNEGEVSVRFIVSERGRAEGVSVSKRVGVAEKAAQCVADVVDRRWVGAPESPMVGATAVFKFSRVKK